ncbi:MAG: undecaprenyl-diphosphatase UppP [Acidobacteria bacterium]|nr:MAG: undecaprenyl-diphosphatase UppP [Acidobacteriota bacterium]
MSLIQAIVLGAIQGLTEFLPISSSGHLAIAHWLFGWSFDSVSTDKAFDAATHLGTLVAATAYFRTDIGRLVAGFFRTVRTRKAEDQYERFAWYLVVASIPGALFGLLGESFIEEKLGAPWLIAVMLAIGGGLLWFADAKGRKEKGIEEVRLRDAGVMGLAQAVALSPGVSRSGVTMTAGLAMGLDRETAARFSFLMLVPIAAGAGLYKVAKLVASGLPAGSAPLFIAGVVTSAVTGFVAIWGLLRFLKTRSFLPFVIYRFVLAAVILAVIVSGLRPATA